MSLTQRAARRRQKEREAQAVDTRSLVVIYEDVRSFVRSQRIVAVVSLVRELQIQTRARNWCQQNERARNRKLAKGGARKFVLAKVGRERERERKAKRRSSAHKSADRGNKQMKGRESDQDLCCSN